MVSRFRTVIHKGYGEISAAGCGKDRSLENSIQGAAGCLSKELLYMKFLQGIPVVGAIGGAYDAVYMKQIMEYAELKYRRRFYLRQKRSGMK